MTCLDWICRVVCLLVLSAGKLSGLTNLVSGPVTTETTWSGTNLLQGTVVVQTGVVLRIAPGARLLMNTGATVVVNGQLLADGTADNPIQYTLFCGAELGSNGTFSAVVGQVDIPGRAGLGSLTDTNVLAPRKFYRVGVKVP